MADRVFLPSEFEAVLRDVHARGFVHGDDMDRDEPILRELLRLGYVQARDGALAAALVALVGSDQPERAAQAASGVLDAFEPSPYGHSDFYDLTEAGFVFLEARPPKKPHCGRIRIWTLYCHGPGRCACNCTGCKKANRAP